MSQEFASRTPAVLQLISSLEVGGIERMMVNFANSCAKGTQIPQVVVVINDRIDPGLALELNSSPLPVYYLNRPESSRNPKFIRDLIRIIQVHRVSVIHSHNPGSKYWSILCRLLIPEIKLVFTLHHTEIDMNTLDVLLHNKMINTTIAISPAVAKEALSFKIKRVEQVANGIPISLFHSINPQHSSSGSRARVVSVGRLSLEKKGQDVLIRAIKRCVDKGLDVDCTLVGSPASGDTTTLPMLTALVSELELTPRIHFVQGRSNVTALLGDADVFVLPSRHEGFGLALVEAMAAGLPVIASDIEGPANIVTDGEDGLLFEPGCDEQLAEKIGTVIQSSRFAQKLSDNARTTSRKYDISLMRDRYTGIYGRLIAQG